MADDSTLHLQVRTPHGSVIDRDVHSLRLPTETGQVGLRAHRATTVLVVEPGLLVIHAGGATSFASTAGGLLRMADNEADLFTPYATTGETPESVLEDLDKQLAAPDSELAMRRRLTELEQRIMRELAQKQARGARSMEAAS